MLKTKCRWGTALRTSSQVSDHRETPKPLAEFHYPFLMAGRTKVPSTTRKCQQIFMATFPTFDLCEAIVQNATVKEAVDHLSHIRTENAILFCKTLIPAAAGLKRLEMVFNTLVILRILWFARTIYRRCAGYKPCLPKL